MRARIGSGARFGSGRFAHVRLRVFGGIFAACLGAGCKAEGEGEQEIGVVAAVTGDRAKCKVGDVIVRVDPRYYRPTEVETLLGDPTKAKEKLGWVPTTSFEELVREMIEADYTSARKDSLVKLAGFQAFDHHE